MVAIREQVEHPLAVFRTSSEGVLERVHSMREEANSNPLVSTLRVLGSLSAFLTMTGHGIGSDLGSGHAAATRGVRAWRQGEIIGRKLPLRDATGSPIVRAGGKRNIDKESGPSAV